MAQLDRFLNLLVTNNGTALLMSEGEVATVTIKDSPRPVMKQPLTSAQILTLVREIAPQNGTPKSPAASPRNEPPRAEAPPAPRAAASGNRALDRIEGLLRTLVG